MSNLERHPAEHACTSTRTTEPLEVLRAREVPLGGPRAMTVRRTLPQRQRSLIGAWCFVDHYGPDRVADSGGMVVPPHPHTGLQTVTWLFTGEVEHRDSGGHHAIVRPGEVNLMTAGRGISHSEYSTPGTEMLHGTQLWVALPDASRHVESRFEHFVPPPVTGPGWEARVFLGSLLGSASPISTHTPLVGAEIRLEPGGSISLPVAEDFEHGLLVDEGTAYVEGAAVAPADLAYLGLGRTAIEVRAQETPVRLVLIGGTPLGEQVVMWWNFIGRTHEEVAAYRQQWEGLLAGTDQERFALPEGDPGTPLHAPPLPNARLRSRG